MHSKYKHFATSWVHLYWTDYKLKHQLLELWWVGGGWLEELKLKQALRFSFGLGLCNISKYQRKIINSSYFLCDSFNIPFCIPFLVKILLWTYAYTDPNIKQITKKIAWARPRQPMFYSWQSVLAIKREKIHWLLPNVTTPDAKV
jgi:hypothetical protein